MRRPPLSSTARSSREERCREPQVAESRKKLDEALSRANLDGPHRPIGALLPRTERTHPTPAGARLPMPKSPPRAIRIPLEIAAMNTSFASRPRGHRCAGACKERPSDAAGRRPCPPRAPRHARPAAAHDPAHPPIDWPLRKQGIDHTARACSPRSRSTSLSSNARTAPSGSA